MSCCGTSLLGTEISKSGREVNPGTNGKKKGRVERRNMKMFPVNKQKSDDEACVVEAGHSSLTFSLVQTFSVVNEAMSGKWCP